MAKVSLRISLIIGCLLFILSTTVESAKTLEELEDLWKDWLVAVEPWYIKDPVETAKRFENFKRSVAYLEQQNNPALGLTKFSDFDQSQLQSIKGYLKKEPETTNRRLTQEIETPGIKGASLFPSTFDWRDYGVVSIVKDQGTCGNCWAFSTTAFYQSEMVRRKRSNNQVDLSQQFFWECDTKSGGCKGGYLETAIDLGLKNGIPYEVQFPWNSAAKYTDICSATIHAIFQNSTRVSYLTGLSNDQIKALLLERPLNIAVAAKDWNNYAPGSQKTYKCPANYSNYASLDHTALLVGWTEKEWIVKNQWGSNWGIGGYIFVSNSDTEDCGIGFQVHTLDFKLDTVNLTTSTSTVSTSQTTTTGDSTTANVVPSINPTNLRPEVPIASVCPLPNCDTCYFGSPSCSACKEGYQLNTLTKTCDKEKIPNCVEFSRWAGFYQCIQCKPEFELKSGACATPGFNPPSIDVNRVTIFDPFVNIPLSFYTRDFTCKLNFCEVCYDNGNQCLTCMTGYAVNQLTQNCQKSPIDGCNLFVAVRDVPICFECRKGYRERGHSICQKI